MPMKMVDFSSPGTNFGLGPGGTKERVENRRWVNKWETEKERATWKKMKTKTEKSEKVEGRSEYFGASLRLGGEQNISDSTIQWVIFSLSLSFSSTFISLSLSHPLISRLSHLSPSPLFGRRVLHVLYRVSRWGRRGWERRRRRKQWRWRWEVGIAAAVAHCGDHQHRPQCL
jgi:hypothetical protein